MLNRLIISSAQKQEQVTNEIASQEHKEHKEKEGNTELEANMPIAENTEKINKNRPIIPCVSTISPAVLVRFKKSVKATKTIQKPKTVKRTSCNVCRKRVGVLGFDCKCGKIFCGAHRYHDKHNCTYDYASSAKEQLVKDNPCVKPLKLADKI